MSSGKSPTKGRFDLFSRNIETIRPDHDGQDRMELIFVERGRNEGREHRADPEVEHPPQGEDAVEWRPNWAAQVWKEWFLEE